MTMNAAAWVCLLLAAGRSDSRSRSPATRISRRGAGYLSTATTMVVVRGRDRRAS